MKENVINYREKHHRCCYCEFYKYRSNPVGPGYWYCQASLKMISYDMAKIRGMFCKYYKINTEGDE